MPNLWPFAPPSERINLMDLFLKRGDGEEEYMDVFPSKKGEKILGHSAYHRSLRIH